MVKKEFEHLTVVMAGAVLFFIANIIAQGFIGGYPIRWLEALVGMALFAVLSAAVIEIRPERRVILMIAIAVALLIIIFCTTITGIISWF